MVDEEGENIAMMVHQLIMCNIPTTRQAVHIIIGDGFRIELNTEERGNFMVAQFGSTVVQLGKYNNESKKKKKKKKSLNTTHHQYYNCHHHCQHHHYLVVLSRFISANNKIITEKNKK